MKRGILLTLLVLMLLSPPFVFGEGQASSNQANEAPACSDFEAELP